MQSINTVTVPGMNSAPNQDARYSKAPTTAPLIVVCHTWSETYNDRCGQNGVFLDDLAMARGWNYISPSIEGTYANPLTCGTPRAVDCINAAINYAVAQGNVDQSKIFVVGGSGGGFMSLYYLMKAPIPIRAVVAFVPITDLEAWYAHSPGTRYGPDILLATNSPPGGPIVVENARARSPLYQAMPEQAVRTNMIIYHGIHDGQANAPVPITHSVRFFNKWVRGIDCPASVVTDAELLQMIETRKGPNTGNGWSVEGRRVHLMRSATASGGGKAKLVINEGTHEIFAQTIMDELSAFA